MKTIHILAFMVFWIGQTLAQNIIKGTVKDKETLQNIPGATVYLSDLKRGTTTDINGAFQLQNIPNGIYLIEVSFVGYKNLSVKMDIGQTEKNEIFFLSESPTELNEVVITGVTRSTEINKSPVIIKALDINKLNQSGSTNLIDALKNVPGISQITTGAAISKPTVRGLGYNRVITLVDGIRQEGQQWGDEHGIEIDEYAIERVEIIKGPGSLLYGSDGLAGVIHFISPKAPSVGEIKTKFITNYQSNNNLIGYSISNIGSKKNIQWQGRLSQKMAGNYENKFDGKVYNTGFSELNGNLFLGLNQKWGFTHFNLSTYNSQLGLAEGERDSLGQFLFEASDGVGGTYLKAAQNNDLNGYGIGIPNQKINHNKLVNNSLFILKKGTINLDLAFQNNKRREFADVLAPNLPELYFDLTSTNYNVRYNLSAKNGWETSIGMGGMYQFNKNKGIEVIIPKYNIFDFGTFIFTQKAIKEQLTLAGGFRFDNRKIKTQPLVIDQKLKFEGFTNNYNNFSGSVGLSYQIKNQSTAKLNLSRGFRAPNIAEISSNGRHEGTFRYEIGNKNLKAEVSNQIDLAYFLNKDHVSIEISPFINMINNYIFAEKLQNRAGNDSIPDFEIGAPAYQFVQGNAMLVGAEFYFDIHPHPLDWLHLENSFSFVQATQNHKPDSQKYLPFIPQAHYRLELKAAFKKIGSAFINPYFKVSFDHYFEQKRYFKAYNTETQTPQYNLLSTGLGSTIKAFGKKDFFNLYFTAENLTNTAYQNHLSRLKYAPENPLTGRMGIFNMGRNLSLKMIFNI